MDTFNLCIQNSINRAPEVCLIKRLFLRFHLGYFSVGGLYIVLDVIQFVFGFIQFIQGIFLNSFKVLQLFAQFFNLNFNTVFIAGKVLFKLFILRNFVFSFFNASDKVVEFRLKRGLLLNNFCFLVFNLLKLFSEFVSFSQKLVSSFV